MEVSVIEASLSIPDAWFSYMSSCIDFAANEALPEHARTFMYHDRSK